MSDAVDDRNPPPAPALTDYLSKSGWSVQGEHELVEVWRPPAAQSAGDDTRGQMQIVVPRADALDAAQQLTEAVRALAFFEHREHREVVDDMMEGPADTLALRLTPDVPSGEAPLGQMHRAIGALHDFVRGAAAALHNDARVLPGRRPVEADAFAEQTRVSTTSGSMIIHLSMPHAGDFDLPAVALPYGRRVTRRMRAVSEAAVTLASSVSTNDAPLSRFGDPDASPANASELAALGHLSGIATGATYALRFSSTPLLADDRKSQKVQVTAEEQEVLREAAKYLRSQQDLRDVRIHGYVVRLHRARAYGPGDITLRATADKNFEERHYKLSLGEADYEDAAQAHPRGLLVSATGTVRILGNGQRRLNDITGFKVEAAQ